MEAGKYVAALASDLPKRNGWTIAQRAGDRTPQRAQRLLNRARWDALATMGVVRAFAVAGLDEAARRAGRRGGLAVPAIDETSQVKQGRRTAGVKRHYLGCVGKMANGLTMVHLAYARPLLANDQDAEAQYQASLGEQLANWPFLRARLPNRVAIASAKGCVTGDPARTSTPAPARSRRPSLPASCTR